MAIISLFNNKGGVGKTTLSYHLSAALAELGKKVLMIDLDSQCNLTMHAIDMGRLQKIWDLEDSFIEEGFETARQRAGQEKYEKMLSQTRTVHFLLKPTEEGTGELSALPPAHHVRKNVDLLPGRLTLYMYENSIADRWPSTYMGHPLAVRTISQIRALANRYVKEHGYDFVIMDTSPNLGALNKVVISTADAFLIPCLPDLFSLYGIRNIGNSLKKWQQEFSTIYSLISPDKRSLFPDQFVRFLGYTIYNAKKSSGKSGLEDGDWGLAKAHLNYARQIPQVIETYIDPSVRAKIPEDVISQPIGGTAVMHSHNTYTSMAQKYRVPMWKAPDAKSLAPEDKSTLAAARKRYQATKDSYIAFAEDFLRRIELSGV